MKQTIDIPKGGPIARVVAVISALSKDKAIRVTIDAVRNNRSARQNRTLWMAYEILSEYTGYEKQELHEEMCKRFFGVVTKEILGNHVARPVRTTTTDEHGNDDVLTWERFSEFYASVQRLGDSLGCYIPDPDPTLRTR